MRTVQEIEARMNKLLAYYLGSDGCLPEADETLNGLTRELIEAFAREHNEPVYLGAINWERFDEPIWEYKGGLVETFGARFIIPCDDDELRHMLIDRLEAPYTGTADDAKRIDAILARIEKLGGKTLVWT